MPTADIPVSEYNRKFYIPWLMAESRYSLSIRTQYRARLQNADPALLAMPVSEVSQSDAQHHVEWMQHSSGKKYAHITVDMSITAFRNSFRYAVKLGLRQDNPFDGIHSVTALRSKAEPYLFTESDLIKLEAAFPHYYEPDLFGAAFHSTLERRDLFSLLIDDIPDEGTELIIRRKAVMKEEIKGPLILKPLEHPKVFRLSEKAMAHLRNAKREELQNISLYGKNFNPDRLLFPDEHGNAYYAARIVEFTDILKEATGVYAFSLRAISKFNQDGRGYRDRIPHTEEA